MKKVGFLGGTFDPIHFGHLNLAIELLEKCGLEKVLFCPTFCSPFKEESPPEASPEDRLEMVKRALKGLPNFEILTLEIENRKTSFTVDTIRKIQRKGEQIYLLLSQDTAADLSSWKGCEELMKLAPPLVGMRRGAPPLPKDPPELKKGLVQTREMEISSTEIRKRVKKGLPVTHLVPSKALDYILEKRLYSLEVF